MILKDLGRGEMIDKDIPVTTSEQGRVLYIILLAIGFFAYSQISEGFYMDDEIGHFVTARDAIDNLWHIFTYWSRPAVKIFYVLPAQAGIVATQLLTIFVSLTTVHFTYKVAKQYRIEHKATTMLFLGLQPLFFQLSFRFYTEIWAALAIIMMIYYWNNKNYTLLAIISSYAFAIRQELVVLSLMLVIYFVYKRQWKAILVLGWMPLVLNTLGWIKTGNPLWLLSEYMPTHTNIGNDWKMGFWVYVENFFNIYGIFIGLIFFVGLLKWRKYLIPFSTFIIMFLFYSILAEPSIGLSRGQGSTRHIIVLSPILAIFAGLGFDYIKSFVSRYLQPSMPLLILPFLIGNLFLEEPPLKLSPEAEAVKQVVSSLDDNSDVYSNHVFVSYYLGKTTKRIREPIGTGYILYDSHYGYRPAWGCTLKPGEIANTKWLTRTVSVDGKFTILLGYKGE